MVSEIGNTAKLELFHGEGHGNPLQYSCLESPMDGGAWWAAIYEVAQSQIRLKRLSSSSRTSFRNLIHMFMKGPPSSLPFQMRLGVELRLTVRNSITIQRPGNRKNNLRNKKANHTEVLGESPYSPSQGRIFSFDNLPFSAEDGVNAKICLLLST